MGIGGSRPLVKVQKIAFIFKYLIILWGGLVQASGTRKIR